MHVLICSIRAHFHAQIDKYGTRRCSLDNRDLGDISANLSKSVRAYNARFARRLYKCERRRRDDTLTRVLYIYIKTSTRIRHEPDEKKKKKARSHREHCAARSADADVNFIIRYLVHTRAVQF